MSPTTHTCEGCHAELRFKDDLEPVQGHTRTTWRCRLCQTTVPGVVAEKLAHQQR